LTRADFRKVSANGFGDRGNAYAHSMAWFKNHLYVGTTRANLANRALQIRKNTPERMKGVVWPVRIPATYWENNLRAEIWRFEPESGAWTNVYTAPLVKGKDGFDVPLSVGFRCMSVFRGESDDADALYVPTWASHQTPSSLLLRSWDGTDFQVVSEPGSAVPENKPRSIRGVLPFKQYLVASPVVGQARFEPNIAGHTVLLASADPARGTWAPACEPGFGDPNNVSAFQMAVLDGQLYAGTLNVNEGFQIWKTAGEGNPPFRWKKVLGAGAGRGRLNQIAMSLCPFGDALYVGTGIQNCSFDYDYNVGPAPPEILRIYPDDTWELVVGEPRITSQGLKVPISGLGPGFECPFAGYLWSLAAHDGWLYAGTGVWTLFLHFRDTPENLPEVLRSLFQGKMPHGYDRLETFLDQYGGCHLWRTRDGSSWVPVTQNGFDNRYNLGVRTQTSTPHGLFLGTANPFGPDVAVSRVAGWRYEANAAGGLEIWQGRVEERGLQTARPLPLRVVAVDGHPLDVEESGERSERNAAALAEAFFDRTRWRALGYWRSGIREAPAACENLMAELVAFLPEAPGRILDVCGGNGASLDSLLERFSSAQVATVIDDRSLRARPLERVAGASVLKRGQLAGSALTAAFDCALWVDALRPRPVSLVKLLRQSESALKPGGRLVAFETLRRRRAGGTARLLGDRYASSERELRRHLQEAGLPEAAVVEVTAACLTPFRESLSRFLTLRALTGEAPEASLEWLESQWCGGSHEIVGCVFIVAEKPGDAQRHRQQRQPGGER
jgi:SAM-dependent methyltransferase